MLEIFHRSRSRAMIETRKLGREGAAMLNTATRAMNTPVLKRMVRRIVGLFRPERIILFGSHARGEANADSDIDLLIVLPFKGSKRQKMVEIAVALHDIPVSKDIVVCTPEEFAWRKDVIGTIEHPAAIEGKVLYAKP
jgi:uncharacterized protein